MTDSGRHPLTVNQVRDNLKQLREAALYEYAEIHFGERGADEVVIVSARTLAALKARGRAIVTRQGGTPSAALRPAKQLPFVSAILAGGTFEGPSDLSERVDEYLSHPVEIMETPSGT